MPTGMLSVGIVVPVNACLQGIAWLLGPSLFSQVHAPAPASSGQAVPGPGAPYLLAAALLAFAAGIAWRATR